LAWPATAFALYLAFVLHLTWPAVSDLGGTLFGAGGDLTGGIAIWRETVDSGHVPFLPGIIHTLNAPEGLPIRWTLNLVAWPTTVLLWLGTLAFGATTAYTLYAVIAMPLSGLAVFQLARRITGNPWAALVGGFAIAFYPFAVVNGAGHSDFVHAWALVLPIWRLLVLAEQPSRRNGLMAGVAASFAMAWTPYFFLFTVLVWGALAIVGLAFAVGDGRLHTSLVPQLTAGAVVTLTAGVMLVLNGVGPASEIRTLPKIELITYSARPYEYVLPPYGPLARMIDSPHYLANHLHGSNSSESTLYVGLSIIALALVAVVALVRGRLRRSQGRAVVMMVAVVVTGLAFSAPPNWNAWGLNLPMPNDLIFHVTSAWRVYSRLVVVVMIGLSVLAAIGVDVLVRGRSRRLQALMLAAIGLVVVTDLAPQTSIFTPIHMPGIYRTLARQPPGIVAQYPLVPAVYSTYNDLWFRALGGHPTLNGYPSGSIQEARDVALANLADPHTRAGLKALGVRYVLVTIVPSAPFPPTGHPGAGYRLIAHDAYASLYRVTGSSASAVAFPGSGFDSTETTPTGTLNWLIAPEGAIKLQGNCRSCRGSVTFKLESFGFPRVVTISISGRGIVYHERVVAPVDVSVPVVFDRTLSLKIATTPGPRAITSILPNSRDPRSVSVSVSNLLFSES
jgi:hypothetical protein